MQAWVYTASAFSASRLDLFAELASLAHRPAARLSKKSQKNDIFLLKKTTQTRNEVLYLKKISFLTQKDLPASQKTEILHDKKWKKKFQKRYQKEHPAPHMFQIWSFAWKIENRPTYGDFEKKNLDPQLHQIFKPIRKFFCTFLPI